MICDPTIRLSELRRTSELSVPVSLASIPSRFIGFPNEPNPTSEKHGPILRPSHPAQRAIITAVLSPRMDSLFTPNRHRGKLIIVEGIDGSGKSTQISLLSRWLRSSGFAVAFSEWNSSPLVHETTRRGKKKEMFTPTTFSLIHATDFADRTERYILPLDARRRHRLRRPLRLHRLRARRGPRRRSAMGAQSLQLCPPPQYCVLFQNAARSGARPYPGRHATR